MELLESVGPRPRQARYQAALRPDMKCCTDFKALSSFAAATKLHFLPQLMCQIEFTEPPLRPNPTSFHGLAVIFTTSPFICSFIGEYRSESVHCRLGDLNSTLLTS